MGWLQAHNGSVFNVKLHIPRQPIMGLGLKLDVYIVHVRLPGCIARFQCMAVPLYNT